MVFMNRLLHTTVYTVIFLLTFGMTSAYAIPSFARQTGLDCAQCHTVFPELTQTGRYFKLHGYTMTNGEKTTPLDNLSGMVQLSYTQNANTTTNPDQIDPAKDKKLSLDQASLFYGGKIIDDLGAFVQLTYDGTNLIGSQSTNDVAHHLVADNVDIRYVKDFTLSGNDLLIGLTLNNNPSMQDIYNTTPTWTFPYSSSANVNSPVSTLIDGGLGQKVAGLGLYAMLNDLLYAEVAGYQSNRSGGPLHILRYNPLYSDTNEVHGTALYTRVALQKNIGDHFFMIGGYTLNSKMDPDVTAPTGLYDRYDDKAIDAQYSYTNGSNMVTVMATRIREKTTLNNSFGSLSDNLNNTLTTTRGKISYYYDQKYGVTVGAFTTDGTADATLYGSSNGLPDSSGKIFELDYLPIQKVKLSLQYTMYDKFNGAKDNYDGAGRNAKDNNNVFLTAWIMF
jgi:hypothetical protein